MQKKLLVLLVIAVLLIPQISSAQSKVGTTAAPWLTIGVGARPQGMGGAYVAVADDIHSIFWNPAGIARMKQPEVMVVHSTWFADIQMEYVAAAFPMGPMGTLGGSVQFIDIGEMEVTTETEQEGTGIFFNSNDLAVNLSYGYQFYDKFSIGANLKYISEKIWNEKASGYAFDIGTLLITPFKDVRLGMNITNFGTKMKMDGRDLIHFFDPSEVKYGNNENVYSSLKTDEWKLPLTMRLGLSGEAISTEVHRVTWAADWVVPNDNTEFYNVGAEYAYNEFVFLRAGFRGLRPAMGGDEGFRFFQEDNGSGATFGGGIDFKLPNGVGFDMDYAFEAFERLGNIHKYSLSFKF